MESKKGIIISGAVIGILAVLLVKMGNPANMGMCVACFIRDIAGGIGFHRAAVVQYIRPEVMGITLGAFVVAFMKKEYGVRGGSSPFMRFVLGIVVMIGALMFLGCPLRMVLRIGGGDLNAIVGLIGFIVGIVVGILFLKKGFSLKRNYKQPKLEGFIFIGYNLALVAFVIISPAFIFFSEKGPGAMHAPVLTSLLAGGIVGILAQRTRLCMVGGTRDMILFKDSYLLMGFLSIILFSAIGNLAFGYFELGFEAQPVAHQDGLWNFLGMVAVGWGSVLLGGCPLRQLILSGEGNSDSVITVFGMLFGAAIAHNFALASSPKGPTVNGQIAVALCFVLLLAISYFNSEDFKIKKISKGEVA